MSVSESDESRQREEIDVLSSSCHAPKVVGEAPAERAKWPSRVMLLGWAADPRCSWGTENPIQVMNEIPAEAVHHNLAQLLKKDPAVELFLVRSC